MVVDDEQDLCEILKFNLETEGYQVATAYSAEEALEKNLARFDLLLLDVMMGGMDGFAMAERLKSNPETAHVPIIFLTAKTDENDKVNGLNLGADDYIAKPFSIREVMARVRAVLRRSGEKSVGQQILKLRGLEVNLDKKTVSIDGEDIPSARPSLNSWRCCCVSVVMSSPARNSSTASGPKTCWCSTAQSMSTSPACARRSRTMPTTS